LLWILLVGIGTLAHAQSGYSQVNQLEGNKQGATTFRIDRGKVWIDDKPAKSDELPASLKKIDPSIYYEANISGLDAFSFSLNGHTYWVSKGKITEVDTRQMESDQANSERLAAEAYYSQLKKESPNLFYGLSREGMLLEKIRSLLLDYSGTKNNKRRAEIKEELRGVLAQLFDLNERNQELEIQELEEMLESAKEELKFRKTNKSKIIDKSLEDLLRE
jgi:hypothetical protein